MQHLSTIDPFHCAPWRRAGTTSTPLTSNSVVLMVPSVAKWAPSKWVDVAVDVPPF